MTEVATFNKTCITLLALIESKANPRDRADVERLRKRFIVLKDISRDTPISVAFPVFWHYSEKIAARDEDFFLNSDAQAELRELGIFTEESLIIADLCDKFKQLWRSGTPEERDIVYDLICRLHDSCLEHRVHSQ